MKRTFTQFVGESTATADGIQSDNHHRKEIGHKEGKNLGKEKQGGLKVVEDFIEDEKPDLGLEMSERADLPSTDQKELQRHNYSAKAPSTKFDHFVIKPKESQDKGADTFEEIAWDFEAEQQMQKNREMIAWIDNPLDNETDNDAMLSEMMETWMKEDNVKLSMDDETSFCDQSVLKGILSGKSEHHNVFQISRATKRSCPFETIKIPSLEKRSFIKMANLDHAFGYMFTNPKCNNSCASLVDSCEHFSFAEICAANGGFREYIRWRKNDQCAKCYSMKNNNTINLNKFKAGSSAEINSQGNDIFNNESHQELETNVMRGTRNKGAHLAISDFSVYIKGQENIQEILFHRLYLCQCLVALTVLRKGGNFVCKLFYMFTPFTVGLVYLMSFCFERIAIFKPAASRLSDSERYLVCQGKRDNCKAVVTHLRAANLRMSEIYPGRSDSEKMISELVPVDQLINDKIFFDFVKESNDRLGDLQIMSLKKIKTFEENSHLQDPYLNEFESSHFKKWGIKFQS